MADKIGEQVAHRYQNQIAGAVSVGVVGALEPVNIAHQHGHRVAATLGARDFSFEDVLQVVAVIQAGERVTQGLFFELFL